VAAELSPSQRKNAPTKRPLGLLPKKEAPVKRRKRHKQEVIYQCLGPIVGTDAHTLILGTFPSVKSLEQEEYFAHPCNLLWWLAGNALGFKCAHASKTKSNGEKLALYKVVHEDLKNEQSLLYEEQLDTMRDAGFAVWDMIGECSRAGSSDKAIDWDTVHFNNLRAFCEKYSIKRICLVNGADQTRHFCKAYATWIGEGKLRKHDDAWTLAKTPKKVDFGESTEQDVQLCVMKGISPAAASIPFEEKERDWEEKCFRRGELASVRKSCKL
jgi:G:T/U-mismatch repair DNA glycosylase